jgi:hypothetical protein
MGIAGSFCDGSSGGSCAKQMFTDPSISRRAMSNLHVFFFMLIVLLYPLHVKMLSR